MKVTKDEARLPRCYVSHCTIPKYTGQERVPTKQQPFKAINAHGPAHTIDVILPSELYKLVQATLLSKKCTWARVYMSLSDIIADDFLNQYVHAGNVLLLSEGRPGITNTFVLRNGVLLLNLDNATYERCGLQGKVAQHPGRKHVKLRWEIELDLGRASLKNGKKLFAKIRRAFETVLTQSLAWLFVDLEHGGLTGGPIDALHPQVRVSEPTVTGVGDVVPPFVFAEDVLHDSLYQEQLLEWLGLVALGSARVSGRDSTDPYLCRYALPEAFEAHDSSNEQDLVHLRWHGLLPAEFTRSIWSTLRRALSDDPGLWYSLSAAGFRGTSLTALCPDGRRLLLWECD